MFRMYESPDNDKPTKKPQPKPPQPQPPKPPKNKGVWHCRNMR